MREYSIDVSLGGALIERESLPGRSRNVVIPAAESTLQHQKISFQQWKAQLDAQSIRTDGIVFLCDPIGVLIDKYDDAGLFNDSRLQAYFADKRLYANSRQEHDAVSAAFDSLQPNFVSSTLHSSPLLQDYDSYAVPIIVDHNQLIGVMGLIVPAPSIDAHPFTLLKSLCMSYRSFLLLELEKKKTTKLYDIHEQIEKEAKRRNTLFQVVKKLHSKIDVDSVLSEVLSTVRILFPDVTFELYLAQDHHKTRVHLKPLAIHQGQDDVCTRAFMEGRVIVETSADEEGITDIQTIAAPLCGKQAVYGVLNIVRDSITFDDTDLRFIGLLADTAGIAFENAILYEQSNLMIRELRLINEIMKRLNQSLKLNDIFNYAASELINIFNADYCLILEPDAGKESLTVQASNLPIMSNDHFALNYGFSGIVFSTKEPIIISDYCKHSAVKSKLMETTNSRSLLACPIIVKDEVVGVILIAHRKPNFFSYENYKLLHILSGHIGLAIANASLHAEVKRMVMTDNLTGLYARHFLDEQVNFMQKKDLSGVLIVTDIDNFKSINDTYGHQVGDQILIQVSGIIKSSIRDTDIAARWGGEEMAIYLPQATIEQTVRVAERIRNRVLSETDPQVTVSCGVSAWNWIDEKISVESLFYKADMALYEAKNSGKNQIRIRV